MDILANGLSIHEQFHDVASFHDALGRLMAMRITARGFRHEVYCDPAFLNANPMPGVSMQQAVGRWPDKNALRAAMLWLTRGPFWDDIRLHGPDEVLECRDDVVTDAAVGGAAYRTLHDLECGLVSFTPSDWNYSPIIVIWLRETDLEDKTATLENWWNTDALRDSLRNAAPPIQTWDDLREASVLRFTNLEFARDCFEPLAGVPFSNPARDRFLVLLDILERLSHAFDASGSRSPEGHRIYQDYFTGANALFSDSADTEKNRFRNELTFPHPNADGQSLFCTWHGKVRTGTLRLHYFGSGKAGEPVYVVYAGPKITKR